MAELKLVTLTNVNMENMSRKDLLNWINSMMGNDNLQVKKIEDLCNGVAYCLIMEQIFPKSIGLNRVKTLPKLEHEYLQNLRLLQNAFTNLKYDKTVPMDKLIKKRFQDNFEFLQWFKKFYDTVSISNNNENSSSTINIMSKPTKVLNRKQSNSKTNVGVIKESGAQTRSVSPDSLRVMKENIEEAQEQIDGLVKERDFYHNKLTSIEALLKKSLEKEEKVDFCQRTLKLIYASDNDLEKSASPCSTE